MGLVLNLAARGTAVGKLTDACSYFIFFYHVIAADETEAADWSGDRPHCQWSHVTYKKKKTTSSQFRLDATNIGKKHAHLFSLWCRINFSHYLTQ